MADDPQTQPAHRPSRRNDILDAATRLFARKGFVDASIADVAEEADVAVTAVYYHFASKDDLVLEVLSIGTALAHDPVERAVADVDLETDAIAALEIAIVEHARAVLGGGDYPRANV